MKWIALLFPACFAVSAFGQSLGSPIYEPFSDSTGTGGTSYAVGASLAGQSQTLAAGFVSGPDTHTGTTSVQSWWSYTNSPTATTWPTIVSGDLSYAGLASSGGGQSVQFGGSGNSALMNLNAGSTGFLPGSGTIFYSFTLQLSDLGTLSSGSSFFAGFTKLVSYNNTTTTPTSVGAQLWVQSDGGTGYQLGISLGGNVNGTTGPLAYDPTSLNVGDTLFVVGSYALNAGGANDTADLWINPDSSTFGAVAAPVADASVASEGATDMARIASFTLFQNSDNEPTGRIDDLRIGLSWADVTPAVPEPTSFALGALGLLALCGRRLVRR